MMKAKSKARLVGPGDPVRSEFPKIADDVLSRLREVFNYNLRFIDSKPTPSLCVGDPAPGSPTVIEWTFDSPRARKLVDETCGIDAALYPDLWMYIIERVAVLASPSIVDALGA